VRLVFIIERYFMEIVIAIFLGAWLSTAACLGYMQLKKDFKENGKEAPKR
jgi:hypothetical protein